MVHDPNAHKPTHDLFYDALMTHNKLVMAISGSGQFQGMTLGVEKEESVQWSFWEQELLYAAVLIRLSILKTAGTATNVNWEIRQSQGGTGTDVVAEGGPDSLDHDEFFTNLIPWISTEVGNLDGLIFVAITPTNGTLDATIRIVAEPRR